MTHSPSRIPLLVALLCAIAFIPILLPNPAQSASAHEEDYANLPSIEATTFPMKVVRRSKSNQVYLFDDVKNRHPQTGRILLVIKDNEQYMAFRVLRLYSTQQYLAAKKVKTYFDHDTLDDGTSFTAIEKISDLDTPARSAKDDADLNELEISGGLKKAGDDSDLDGDPKTRRRDQSKDDLSEGLENSPDDPNLLNDEGDDTLVVQDIPPMDPFHHSLMIGFGYVNNLSPAGSYYFSSGNIRYGLKIKSHPFLYKTSVQDSLTLETGFYGYKGLNIVNSPDSYTVMSTVLDLRYTLMTSTSFAVFAYLGIIKGWVIASTNATSTETNALNSVLPSIGVGFLVQLGPQWFSRVDLGIDALGLSLVLKF